MTVTVGPGSRWGEISIPASKSQAHRLLICAALGRESCRIACDGISRDIAATAVCLNALGAEIRAESEGVLSVEPIEKLPQSEICLPCGESGSTLRFLLPLVGALGAEAVFIMEGRLPERPLAPLDSELERHGMSLRREGEWLYCRGRLSPGEYSLPGNVSSQYISGLLMALPLLDGESSLQVAGELESSAYVDMTEDALGISGIVSEKKGWTYRIPGGQRAALPRSLRVEGDYSNAAFFLCMGAVSEKGILVSGLGENSRQGDRAVLDILRRFGARISREGDRVLARRGELRGCTIDASPIPDLIPVLSVLAAGAEGETRVIKAGRLRLKESDRLKSSAALLRALGAQVRELDDGLVIRGRGSLTGGRVDSWGDHRIAMSAAMGASLCCEPVIIDGAEAVNKSYPNFWRDLESLSGGGK